MSSSTHDFDRRLRLLKGKEQYLRDKSKAGRMGSSAGRPRPYARQLMKNARLYSPTTVGQTLIVTPLDDAYGYVKGHLYEWKVEEEGLGRIGNQYLSADEIRHHFKVIPKKKG